MIEYYLLQFVHSQVQKFSLSAHGLLAGESVILNGHNFSFPLVQYTLIL